MPDALDQREDITGALERPIGTGGPLSGLFPSTPDGWYPAEIIRLEKALETVAWEIDAYCLRPQILLDAWGTTVEGLRESVAPDPAPTATTAPGRGTFSERVQEALRAYNTRVAQPTPTPIGGE